MDIFLLQTLNGEIVDEEVLKVKCMIDNYLLEFGDYSPYNYKLINTNQLKNLEKKFYDIPLYSYIPIGDFTFVNEFLKIINSNSNVISSIPNIQVPKSLQDKEFLGRDYAKIEIKNNEIVSCEGTKLYKKIPNHYIFIKENKIKGFTFLAHPNNLNLQDGDYIISECVDIISEYRIFVRNKIVGVQFYDGDCTVFPDIEKINKIILKLKTEKQYDIMNQSCYCLDVAVIKNNQKLDTVLIEMSPVICIGTYGFCNPILLRMYIKSYEWSLNNITYRSLT